MPRPRDPALDTAILDAATAIAGEQGLDAVTVAAVAERAGVGRPTVYRRYPTAAALLFEVQLAHAVPETLPDTGSLREDLVLATRHLVGLLSATRVAAEPLAAMMTDRAHAEQVWERWWRPSNEAMAQLWHRAVERGEARADVDAQAAIDEMVAMAILKTLFWWSADDWIEAWVDRLLSGYAN